MLDSRKMIMLPFICELFELHTLFDAKFMRPLNSEVLTELTLAEVGKLLLDLIEVFVLKEQVSTGRLLGHVAGCYLAF